MADDDPLPAFLSPMLATAGRPPQSPGWAFEFKWDGVRAVIGIAGERWRAHSRNGNDLTTSYPELAGLASAVRGRRLLLDGEVVALDAAGRPDFPTLQRRMHVKHPPAELLGQVPVLFYAFDLLVLDGDRITNRDYATRRALLDGLDIDRSQPWLQVPPSIDGMTGAQVLEVARQHRLEGVVAKRRTARYEPGKRSPAWVKTALVQTQEVVVAGWRPGKGRRANGVGSLVLGAHDDGSTLRYVGDVGTGFTDRMLDDLAARLAPLSTSDVPFDEIPREFARGVQWVRPQLVGEVEFRVWTPDGRLRHAAWRGLRADKDPGEVELPPRGRE